MEKASYGLGDGDRISPATEIDGLLAGVGYSIRPSDLRHVAERLEKLDSAMIAAAAAGLPPEFLCSDAVHYNPSDLAAWVDSMAMLTKLPPDHFVPTNPAPAAWTDEICPPAPPPAASVAAMAETSPSVEEEDAGIRLVHLLMTCADFIQRGDCQSATAVIEEMELLLPRVGIAFGIGKVACFFVEALNRRLRPLASTSTSPLAAEHEIFYHYFYEASPYLKFAHFTANQAIVEAFEDRDRVHVIDLNLMHGLQWPALIQALALRPGGPPFLRLTVLGPPSADGRNSLCEVGHRLADLAYSVGVPFDFRVVVAVNLDEVRPRMLRVEPGEAVAVNSVLQLHRLLRDPGLPGPIDTVLSWIAELRPLVLTVVEQEADHNRPAFLDRFTQALFYYSTVLDSLEAGAAAGGQVTAELVGFAELYLQREICNIVCCEGADRVERHEPLTSWRSRLGHAGFWPAHLGSNAFRQASMLLTLFSGEGYGVEEVDGCLTLGWHGRAVISASAWHLEDYVAAPPAGNILPNYDNSHAIRVNYRDIGESSSSSAHRNAASGSQT
ncbi:hypothetical protein HPP92_008702 [Vanilla planifolia]|uniref:DELLA protein n=1 Tax=Vanilla planifolia TaxID=51239 RepID=A0A835RDU3_VANPL|nr:hypothetical protein HPP92_008702 [Vanilla planifolia]